jgi:aminoglycoside/choline kinase family phosphotransferase
LTWREAELQERLRPLIDGPNPPERISPLTGDASTRRYFRASYPSGRTAIIMLQPGKGRNEEASFLDVQRFLAGLGLPVPEVYLHDPKQSLILLEDLGDHLLETVIADADRARTSELYYEAVDILVQMRQATAFRNSGCGAFGLAFDEQKLMEELHFFVTHFLKGLCKLEASPKAMATLETFFATISTMLAAEPRVFAHRDYHSRNLVVHEGRLVMIDFQDARMGPVQYDLASLLRDSYASIPEDLVEKLVRHYLEATNQTATESLERFRYIFDVTSLQRNIKALGTFGYQLEVLGATRYRSAIPRTGAYVSRTLARYEEFTPFRSAVEDYICAPALNVPS